MKRLLFGSILAALLAVVLTACGGTETETIVVKEEVIREVPVEVVVEKEVIKEVMVPGETVVVKEEVIKEVQVAGETVVVTKEVPVEVVREVVKQVEVVREVEIPAETFVMTKKRHPLIGDLEGPTVLPGFVPAKYSEAPMLAAQVAAGKLPPVEERVGPEPLVMRPTHEVGKYGGTWHRGFIGPNDGANGVRAIWHDRLLYWNTEGTEIVPNMAHSCIPSDDGKTNVFTLRQGHRWSDGAPFTADDFMFWFESLYSNKAVIPAPRQQMLVEGTPVTMQKIDDTHIAWVSEKPYWLLCESQSLEQAIGGHARMGRSGMGGFAPTHYLQQFHPDFVGQAKADELAKAAGFDDWGVHIKAKNSAYHNDELPQIAAWTMTVPITQPTWEFQRNAYSIWMDEAGNQLPYIDYIVMTVGESLEVLNLRAIAGEYDSMARHMDLQKLPVFLENQEKGEYKPRLDVMRHGGDAYVCPNLNYDADPEIEKWITNVDFRRALSMGIDRDKVNEVFFLNLGTPGSMAPVEGSLYSPGPDEVFRSMWSTHDLETANTILDSIGLDKRDSQGFRLRTDGSGDRLTIAMDTYLSFMSYVQLGEMIKEHWKDIGIDLEVKEFERGLTATRRRANEHQLYVDTNWAAENAMAATHAIVPNGASHCGGPLYGAWFASNGESGVEPFDSMSRAMDLIKRGKTLKGNARREAGKEAWRLLIDEQWKIGVVGMTPAIQGLRVVKNHLGNIAASTINSAHHDNPGLSRPEQWYFKVDPHTH